LEKKLYQIDLEERYDFEPFPYEILRQKITLQLARSLQKIGRIKEAAKTFTECLVNFKTCFHLYSN
jgi:hypothetical protein